MLKYQIYTLNKKTVCVPSEDYYSRSMDWWKDDIQNLEPYHYEFFETIDAAIKYLEDPKNDVPEGNYIFMPIYCKEAKE